MSRKSWEGQQRWRKREEVVAPSKHAHMCIRTQYTHAHTVCAHTHKPAHLFVIFPSLVSLGGAFPARLYIVLP